MPCNIYYVKLKVYRRQALQALPWHSAPNSADCRLCVDNLQDVRTYMAPLHKTAKLSVCTREHGPIWMWIKCGEVFDWFIDNIIYCSLYWIIQLIFIIIEIYTSDFIRKLYCPCLVPKGIKNNSMEGSPLNHCRCASLVRSQRWRQPWSKALTRWVETKRWGWT